MKVPGYIRGVALGLPLYLTAIHLWTWLLSAPGDIRARTLDFRQSYAAARIVDDGRARELYNYDLQKQYQDTYISWHEAAMPYVAPAYEAWLMRPFARFTFQFAYWLFLGINLCALTCIAILLVPWMRNIAQVYWWLPIALFTGFLPFGITLIHGQDSIFLTLCLVVSFILLAREREGLAGAVCSLALFKFQIVLPIVALFFFWRRWRFVAGLAVASVPVVAGCFLITGWQGQKEYAYTILSMAGLYKLMPLAAPPVHWGVMANLHGLFGSSSLAMAASAVLLGLVAYLARMRGAEEQLVLAIPTAILVGHHTYMHDLSPLILPIAILLDTYLPDECGGLARRWLVRAALLLFAAPVMVSFAPSHFNLVALAIFVLLITYLKRNWDPIGRPLEVDVANLN